MEKFVLKTGQIYILTEKSLKKLMGLRVEDGFGWNQMMRFEGEDDWGKIVSWRKTEIFGVDGKSADFCGGFGILGIREVGVWVIFD